MMNLVDKFNYSNDVASVKVCSCSNATICLACSIKYTKAWKIAKQTKKNGYMCLHSEQNLSSHFTGLAVRILEKHIIMA